MNKNTKLYSILCYIFWIGWALAFFLRDKDDTLVRHHLNQAFVLNVANSMINGLAFYNKHTNPFLSITSLALSIFYLIGLYRAYTLSNEPLPFLENVNIID